jgi:hypothetical protein
VNPAQPEVARQLALHASPFGDPIPCGRLEDRNTCCRQCPDGRDADARNALFVTVASPRTSSATARGRSIASYGAACGAGQCDDVSDPYARRAYASPIARGR